MPLPTAAWLNERPSPARTAKRDAPFKLLRAQGLRIQQAQRAASLR